MGCCFSLDITHLQTLIFIDNIQHEKNEPLDGAKGDERQSRSVRRIRKENSSVKKTRLEFSRFNLLIDLLIVAAIFIVVAEKEFFIETTMAYVLYVVLLVFEFRIEPRFTWYSPLHLGLQISVILALFAIPSGSKLNALLFMPLTNHVIRKYTVQTAILWLVGCGMVLAFAFHYFWGEQLVEIVIGDDVIYFVGNWLAVGWIWSWKEAAQARQQSQYLLQEFKQANNELQSYARQVEELTTVRERNQLARELHDGVIQAGFSMTLHAKSALILLEHTPIPREQVIDQVKQFQEQAQYMLSEIRLLMDNLRSSSGGEIGLVAALRLYIRRLKQNEALFIDFQSPPEKIPLLPTQQFELFRVIQEALNNITRHAQTKQAEVSIQVNPETVIITIRDTGVGFDPNNLQVQQQGMGLTNMCERVKAVGGTVEITSQPNQGTLIKVLVPTASEV